MNPLKLTLRNFTGIRAGLGRDELMLDLATLVGNAVLVAISGPNGTGKTTVLDSLTPYRLMPFRAGGYTPGSFSYYDHICAPEASKELTWEHGGVTYRSTLLFKDSGKTKKTEAYLHWLSGDQWQAFTAPDGTISDGKTDTYDRCVEAILGSPEMFFTSVFAAQGRRQLSAYTPAEIKAVLSELLGLDHILELGAQAGDVAKAVRAKLDAAQETLRTADDIDGGIAAALAERDDRKATLALNDHAIAAIRATAQQAQRAHAEAQANQRQHVEIEIRRQRLTARLAEMKARFDTAMAGIASQTAAEQRRAETAKTELGAWIAAAMARCRSLCSRSHVRMLSAIVRPRTPCARSLLATLSARPASTVLASS
jgi:exonuclease SbcC